MLEEYISLRQEKEQECRRQRVNFQFQINIQLLDLVTYLLSDFSGPEEIARTAYSRTRGTFWIQTKRGQNPKLKKNA